MNAPTLFAGFHHFLVPLNASIEVDVPFIQGVESVFRYYISSCAKGLRTEDNWSRVDLMVKYLWTSSPYNACSKTQNTAGFEVPLCAVVGRRYEYVLKSMLKWLCLVTFKGTTSKFGIARIAIKGRIANLAAQGLADL